MRSFFIILSIACGLVIAFYGVFFVKVMSNKRYPIYSSEKDSVYIFEQGVLSKKMRCLSFGALSNVRQGCIFLNDHKKLTFDFAKLMMAALYLNPQPKKILVIGLGIGMLPRAMLEIVPDAKIDAIEISAKVFEVAKEYFFFSENSNIKVFIQDGFDFVKMSAEKGVVYDLIIMDAFDDSYIPDKFLTDEFMGYIKSSLSEDGVFAMNTFSNSPRFNEETDLIKRSFGGELLELKTANRIILARKNGAMNQATIRQASESFDKKFRNLGIDTAWLLNRMEHK